MSCDQPTTASDRWRALYPRQADQDRQEAMADQRTRARIARDTLADRQPVAPLECRCELETHVPHRIGDRIFLKCAKCRTLTEWTIPAPVEGGQGRTGEDIEATMWRWLLVVVALIVAAAVAMGL